jgi:catechol 2,3-dioxygenase-like lactoylglutathione lyase family enzyme
MNSLIREKILSVCAEKIKQKGENVQVSFYAFFANKNEDPVALMNVACWWIQEHQLNHFEKATKIYAMVKALESVEYQKTKVIGFNHLTLSVSDLEESLRFYRDFLGFQGEVRWNRGAYLSYGDCWLCLSIGNPSPSQDYSHFALTYDRETIQLICQKDAFQQVTLWQENSSEGDSLYIEDPDGHKLELHAGSLSTRLESLKKHPYDGLEWLK